MHLFIGLTHASVDIVMKNKINAKRKKQEYLLRSPEKLSGLSQNIYIISTEVLCSGGNFAFAHKTPRQGMVSLFI